MFDQFDARDCDEDSRDGRGIYDAGWNDDAREREDDWASGSEIVTGTGVVRKNPVPSETPAP